MANFMMNSVFLFSIFTWEPFLIWEKPQKVFLGSNTLFFIIDAHFFLFQYFPQLVVCVPPKNKYTFYVKKWALNPRNVFGNKLCHLCFVVKWPFYHQ